MKTYGVPARKSSGGARGQVPPRRRQGRRSYGLGWHRPDSRGGKLAAVPSVKPFVYLVRDEAYVFRRLVNRTLFRRRLQGDVVERFTEVYYEARSSGRPAPTRAGSACGRTSARSTSGSTRSCCTSCDRA